MPGGIGGEEALSPGPGQDCDGDQLEDEQSHHHEVPAERRAIVVVPTGRGSTIRPGVWISSAPEHQPQLYYDLS